MLCLYMVHVEVMAVMCVDDLDTMRKIAQKLNMKCNIVITVGKEVTYLLTARL